jgi:DNA (cytosine-5)-methyltransferase 1
LAASYYFSSPRDILIAQEGKNPRKLTILESLRLMGFPKSCERWFDGTEELPVSVRQAGKQFGNSVVVPLVTNILEGIAGILE